MLLTALDGNGIAQQIVVQGQETIVDFSGAGTGAAQALLPVTPTRSGYIIQNKSQTAQSMWVSDTGTADPVAPGSFEVGPGQYFPPPGYPLTTNAVSIFAAAGDSYTVREW